VQGLESALIKAEHVENFLPVNRKVRREFALFCLPARIYTYFEVSGLLGGRG